MPMSSVISRVAITLAFVFLARSATPAAWSKWPWVTRMASSCLGFSIFGAIGLSNHGSMAIVAPPGVVMTQAAWPQKVAVVPVGAAAALSSAARAGVAR